MGMNDESKVRETGHENKKKLIITVPATVSFTKLLSYADQTDWVLIALGTLGSMVHGMAQPVGYLLLGKALNAFGSNIGDINRMVDALYEVVPFVWYMAIATLPAGVLEVGCWMYTSERQVTKMRLAFLKAVLEQDVAAFDTDLTSGKIISGISNHMSIIQDAIGEKLGHFSSCLATFFCGLLIALICCWEVSLLGVFVVPMILIIGATYTKKMNTFSAIRTASTTEATSMVEQTISQIKTVFAFVGEASATMSFSECMSKQYHTSKREALVKGVGIGTLQTVSFGSWALIVWVGAVVVTANRASGGNVIAAVMSILFGAISLTYAAPDLQIFNQAKAAGHEVFQVMERKGKIGYGCGKKLEKIDGKIEICDVHFAYPSRPDKQILKGFSLSIPAGKVVALVGSSGCGKSTITSLVARFYDPTKGEILIDDHNTKDLDLKFLRDNIGAVSQEPSLFTGSIEDNMKMGRMDANEKQIKNAAEMANAHTFISSLPNQYLTEVGQRGVQLSGGQKQRIAIARAILKDPRILLLDEATSALDSESERLVQAALETVMKGRTVIMIAHRMSTIVNADIIVVVKDGQVDDTGTHQSLLETSETYHHLFNMQCLNNVDDSSSCFETRGIEEELKSIDETQVHIEPENDTYSPHRPTEESKSEKISTRSTFLRMWFGYKMSDLVKTVAGCFAAALSGISKPFFGFFIITIGVAYYKPDAKQKVGWYSLIFASIGFLSLISHILQHYLFGQVGEKAMKNLRNSLYERVLRNEVGWFERPENSIGLITSRIINDTSMVKTVIADRMSLIVQCISSILIATIVSMIVNWRMALVAWAVMPCHFIGGLIQSKSAKGFAGDSATAHNEIIELVSESSANIRTVASFCCEEHVLKRAKVSLAGPLKKSRRESIIYGVIQGVSLCLWNVAHAVALWYTTVLVDKRQSSFENAIRSYQIFSLTVPSITELWTLIPTVIAAVRVLTPAFQTLDRRTEIDPDIPEDPGAGTIEGSIEFQEVRFCYPLRPQVAVLNKFNLKIEAGSNVALVGPSGSGKSSVLALILRFYNADKGKVVIDGKDIQDYNLRWLRSHIGMVQQEPLLFSSSIRSNIMYGNNAASESEMVEASRAANIHEFISGLPEGYDTVVGEKGSQLSGGQKQRIAIARTLLKRPKILLLDEATSALDAESEKAVVDALEMCKMSGEDGSLLSTSTRITVAHRLSTIVKSETIVVMEKGQVVEMGSHSILIQKMPPQGIYSTFFKLQSLSHS